MKSKIYYDCSL